MRIQHNIAALNAHRYLSANNDAVAKNLEKLSSGYRINRAGDDAAGLSISEKMRAQIKGLETATKNAQDGVSLVQTAEGNLTEVHSMLNRMVELSTQAANGTYQDLNRAELQKEVTSLTSEIDRISSSANFNGIKLLDGSLGGDPVITTASVGGATKAPVSVPVAGSSFSSTATATGGTAGTSAKFKVEYKDAEGNTQSKTIDFKEGGDAKKSADAIVTAFQKDATLNGLFDIAADATGKLTLTSKTTGSKAPAVTKIGEGTAGATNIAGTSTAGTDAHDEIDLTGWAAGDSITVGGKAYTGLADRTALTAALKKDGIILGGTDAKSTFKWDPAENKGGLMLQIGESNDSYQQVHVSVGKMDSKSLGLGGLDLSTQQGALDAIDTVTKAIDQVSATRGSLGAVQNRLDHTINNLSVTDENMTAAESRIRDVDMAKEMMNFTKNNILTQAAQSMLAQANTLPQGVLQLLR